MLEGYISRALFGGKIQIGEVLALRELLVFRCILTRIRTQSGIDADQTPNLFFLNDQAYIA